MSWKIRVVTKKREDNNWKFFSRPSVKTVRPGAILLVVLLLVLYTTVPGILERARFSRVADEDLKCTGMVEATKSGNPAGIPQIKKKTSLAPLATNTPTAKTAPKVKSSYVVVA